MKKEKDIVFQILSQMLSSSPEASYKRLNPALRSTLCNCIEADLPFQPDTFIRVYNDLRGRWWFGDGNGSHIGEGFYDLACRVNHASACLSFEAFAKRPPVLWEENVKTPERLHGGKRFTWLGRFVQVTSMQSDRLVACDVQHDHNNIEGLSVGADVGLYNDRHVIVSKKRDGKFINLRVTKAVKPKETIRRRFIIPFEEIAEHRRTAKKRVKEMIALIEACDPDKAAPGLAKQINAQNFRHFELEEINAAFAKRREVLANAGRIEAWRKGTSGAWLETKEILLRLNGDRVECSNGNSVSANTVRRTLPIVVARRNQYGPVDLPLDSYRVNRLSAKGVQIGCTLVPWTEVDYIQKSLSMNDNL